MNKNKAAKPAIAVVTLAAVAAIAYTALDTTAFDALGGGIVDESFTSPTLDASWTELNNPGGCTFGFAGSGTEYELTAQVGTEHHPDHGGVPWQACTIYQAFTPVTDDFEVTVRFAGAALQDDGARNRRGIYVKQAGQATNILFFAQQYDTGVGIQMKFARNWNDDETTYLNATGSGNANPIRLRLARVGTSFTASYSATDNDSYTVFHTEVIAGGFDVDRIGIFAANDDSTTYIATADWVTEANAGGGTGGVGGGTGGVGGGTGGTAGTGAVGVPSVPSFTRTEVDDPAGITAPFAKNIADLNGDGYTDMIVGWWNDGSGGEIAWYAGPAFTTRTVIDSTTSSTTDNEACDTDGDGDLDVIILNEGGGVEHLRNDGAGASWTKLAQIDASDVHHDLEIFDFDPSDGNAFGCDFVARDQDEFGGAGNLLVIYDQTSTTTWTKRGNVTMSQGGEGLVAADLDGDGDKDVIVNETWFENDAGVFTEYEYGVSWTHLHAYLNTADIDGDGDLDILIAPAEPASGSYRVDWFANPGGDIGQDLAWAATTVLAGTEATHHYIGAADFDLDGDADIITARHESSAVDPKNVIYLRNDGSGATWTEFQLDTTAGGSHSMKIFDADLDGDPDIYGANFGAVVPADDAIYLWTNNTVKQSIALDVWARHLIHAKPADQRGMFIDSGDIDGDGDLDVVSGRYWYAQGATLGSWTSTLIGTGLLDHAALYDADHDGDLDIIGLQGEALSPDAGFTYADNDGSGNFTMRDIGVTGPSALEFLQGRAVGRLSTGEPTAVALSWHENPALPVQALYAPAAPLSGAWTLSTINTNTEWEGLSIGDINRDLSGDVATGAYWLANDGAVPYTTRNKLTADFDGGDHPDRVELADINQDGRLDVVIGFVEFTEGTAPVKWYEAPVDPTGIWTAHTISTTVTGPQSLDVGDIDRDGDIDVVVGEHKPSSINGRTLIFENVGAGTSWTQHVVNDGASGDEHHDGTQLVDIDRDGDLDVISMGFSGDNVVLYENQNGAAAGTGGTGGVAGAGGAGGTPCVPKTLCNEFTPTAECGTPPDGCTGTVDCSTPGCTVQGETCQANYTCAETSGLFLDGFFPIGDYIVPASNVTPVHPGATVHDWAPDERVRRGINVAWDPEDGQYGTDDVPAWDAAMNAAGLKVIRAPIGSTQQELEAEIAQPWILGFSHRDEPDLDDSGTPPYIDETLVYTTIPNNAAAWRQAMTSAGIDKMIYLNLAGYNLMHNEDNSCMGPPLTPHSPGEGRNDCYPTLIAASDMISQDFYPTGFETTGGYDTNKDIRWVSLGSRRLRGTLSANDPPGPWIITPQWTDKPLGCVIENGFVEAEGTYPNFTSRYSDRAVSPAEMRAQIFWCLVDGARMYYYFTPQVGGGGYWNDGATVENVAEMIRTNGQITALALVLQDVINPPSMTVVTSDPIRVGVTWRDSPLGKYVFAVNSETTQKNGVTITMTGVSDGAGAATVYDEARALTITGGVITDDFGPLEVHIYEMEAAACVPTTTCATQGITCGPATDNCGNALDCDVCAGCAACVLPEVCTNGTCFDPGDIGRVHVSGSTVLDACNDPVQLIGVTDPTMQENYSGAAFSEIARTGANVVRMFWFELYCGGGTGADYTEAETAIQAAIDAGLYPMLGGWDAIGPDCWSSPAFTAFQNAVDRWTDAGTVAMINRHEEYLIINPMVEAGPSATVGTYPDIHLSAGDLADFQAQWIIAIGKMRTADIQIPIVIDAPHWGRDEVSLTAVADALQAYDATVHESGVGNLIFSWHPYDPEPNSAITTRMNAIGAQNQPWLIGEFANREPGGGFVCTGGLIDHTHIIEEANRLGLGWQAWSWGQSVPGQRWNTDCSEFDMTDTQSADSLFAWGLEVAVTDPESARCTSVRSEYLVDRCGAGGGTPTGGDLVCPTAGGGGTGGTGGTGGVGGTGGAPCEPKVLCTDFTPTAECGTPDNGCGTGTVDCTTPGCTLPEVCSGSYTCIDPGGDTTPPDVTGVNYGAAGTFVKTVAVSGSFVCEVNATDLGVGIANMGCTFEDAAGFRPNDLTCSTRSAAAAGLYRCTVSVPASAPTGDYTILEITVADTENNETRLRPGTAPIASPLPITVTP